jgi:drug/metabolite transporter (DMT)-like permease
VLVLGLWRRSLPPGLWRAAIAPSLINAVSQTLFCWTFYKINPGLATFGLRSNIVFATIGAAVFFAAERRIVATPGFIAGILGVVGGTAGTMLLGENGPPQGASLVGVTLATLSGAGFAAYAIAVRHFMHGVNPIQSFAAISLLSALPMVATMLVYGDPSANGRGDWGGAVVLDLSPGQFVLLLVSAIIGIALGHVFYYFSISKLGVAVSAGVVQLQPIVVSVASFWLFGEELTPAQWVCGGVAVAGAAGILYVQNRLAHPPEPLDEDEERAMAMEGAGSSGTGSSA